MLYRMLLSYFSFIDCVEADRVDEADVLVGGEAIQYVGNDHDPSKMSLENLLKKV